MAADAAFFAALLAADAARLEAIAVRRFPDRRREPGRGDGRAPFIGFVASGAARFEAIETNPADCVVRFYGDAAIVVGATAMRFKLEDGTSFAARSRYTHVFARARSGAWRLASAQGTRIAA